MTQPSTPSASAAPALTVDGRARLSTALELEHQAIYGYGALGPYLPSKFVAAARAAEATHRARRDSLETLLGDGAPAGQAAYALPEQINNSAAAFRLAALLEDGVTTAYRAVLAATEGIHRKLALDAMLDAAGRAAAWRRASGQVPGTVPFPGRPS
jgi:hypothetical protein